MITHDAASELLPAHALDAVVGEEQAQLDAHVDTCRRCRAELDALREVASTLGDTAEPPPEGVWSGIATRLPERPDRRVPPPVPRPAAKRPVPAKRPAPPGQPARRTGTASRARRAGPVRLAGRERRVVAALSAALVAAAIAIAVLAVALVRADDRSENHEAAPQAESATAASALATPGHTLVDMETTAGVRVAQFVLVPGGRGYLVSSSLPRLDSGHSYQLWGIVSGSAISLGLLGASPSQSTFTLAGATASRILITEEPSGGSLLPTGHVVATGFV